MRPPICAICHVRFSPDEGGLVTFVVDDATKAYREKKKQKPGFVGHPPNQEWFCQLHVEGARALTELKRSEALAKLKSAQET